jgi:uncharacterized membrane protein
MKMKTKATLALAGVIGIIVALFVVFPFTRTGETRTATEEGVSYPLSKFDDGKAKFFQYKAPQGITVKYFILKSSDGVVRAAFDACDVCWPAGKGYYQDGDVMVCRNCGRRFPSVKVNEVKGGCNPAPLTREIVGDQLVIQVSHLMEGTQYFDFSKRR